MSLQHELGMPNPITRPGHEAALSVVLTGNLLVKEADRIVRRFRVTDSQFNVLMLLKYQSNGGKMSQTGLGEMLVVNRSNVTGLVDRMEQAGWVKRMPDAEDRRVKQVQITAAGLQVVERAEKAYFARIRDVMSSLSAEESARLCRLLERVRAAVRETDQANRA